ncbi:MAG: zinc ribbon domain-containing protein [Oculatellaceae cyanobacterium bins.114]|nr:zinc ribbon domain-containing protein [Oculatellaceae cyanobacterium bins.114]
MIVLVLIDIFILVNVFSGLSDISQWYLSPWQVHPCYTSWNDYRAQTTASKGYDILRAIAAPTSAPTGQPSLRQTYTDAENGHLGTVSQICLTYASYADPIVNSDNQQIIQTVDQKQSQIATLEDANRNLRAQYDSTLLEEIAGQPREQSINPVEAARVKETLDQNARQIATLKAESDALRTDLINKPESTTFLNFLKDDGQFQTVQAEYDHDSFWYPSIQLSFQVLFLLPLIVFTGFVHHQSQRRGYGLVALISWHLLVIFFIPLVFKAFEFLQVGAFFELIVNAVSTLLGGLLFLVSYLYILLIPLIGFGIIKFFQRFAFNPKIQAAKRVQNSSCIKCAKRIRRHDVHCPHCGYNQYTECPTCHEPTYKYLPHCRQCGAVQPLPGR